MGMGVILLARHGQASFDSDDYDLLSPLGVHQAEVLGQALARRYGKVDVMISGAMRRQRQTADAVIAGMRADIPVEIDEGWDEYDHRDLLAVFEPRYRDFSVLREESARLPDPKRSFQELWVRVTTRWREGTYDEEYRESWPAFRGRVSEALARTSLRTGEGEVTLVCSSGGAISVVCAALLGLSDAACLELSWRIVNASVTKLVVTRDGVHLSTLNDYAHLETVASSLVTYR
jgi:broad specificity phosphatase PhoE